MVSTSSENGQGHCIDERTSAPSVGDPLNTLEYAADLILELQDMAARSGLVTLATYLALAHAEARLRQRELRSAN